MTLPSCCDVTAHEKALKAWGTEQPNLFSLPSAVWADITVRRPSLLVPVSNASTGNLYIAPDRRRPVPGTVSSTMQVYASSGTWGFLPNAGTWWLYSTESTQTDYVVLDASNPVAAEMYRGLAYSPMAHTAPSIATTSTTALGANPRSAYRIFTNISSSEIYLSLGGTAVASTGIPLLSRGSVYEMSGRMGNLYVGVITAIAVGAAGTLLVGDGGPAVPT